MHRLGDDLLAEHLGRWIGAWPPVAAGVTVVDPPLRAEPTWDGSVRDVVGVSAGEHGAVLSVPPGRADAVRALGDDLDVVLAGLGEALGRPGARAFRGVFRWSADPAAVDVLPDAGAWLPWDHPAVPPWLHPFGGEVLVTLDDGRYVAGVGVKRHDDVGHEISVGTEEAARGRGLARRLVAQAARRLVAEGKVVTYLHAPDNWASAKVADACGFPDEGWKVIGLF